VASFLSCFPKSKLSNYIHTPPTMKVSIIVCCLILGSGVFVGTDAFSVMQTAQTRAWRQGMRLGLSTADEPTEDDECLITNGETNQIGNDVPRAKYPPCMYRDDGSATSSRVKKKNGRKNEAVSIPGNREFSQVGLPASGSLEEINESALKTRLLVERCYANKECFDIENLHRPPGLQNLMGPVEQSRGITTFWISPVARILSFGLAFFAFPYIIFLLDMFVSMEPERLDGIARSFGPGISILYGTFVSLTLSILYQRQKAIQESVATESSLLVTVLRTSLSVFKGYQPQMLEAGQIVADQVRTLVKCSRGVELMQIMYTDPYASLLELVNDFEQSTLSDEELVRRAGLVGHCRDLLKELSTCRSIRLAEEARALPPTHFLVLNLLTCLILLSFCLNVLPTIESIGGVSNESSLIFGILTTIYVLFYNFADDLNSPFKGVYQVRRSTAASHLLEAKWLISNHPVLRDRVDFESSIDDENVDRVKITTPGVGETWFVKDDFYVTDNGNTNDLADLQSWLGLKNGLQEK